MLSSSEALQGLQPQTRLTGFSGFLSISHAALVLLKVALAAQRRARANLSPT